MERPQPPLRLQGEIREPESFVPSDAVEVWLRRTFIEAGPLHNPEHEHLQQATIGVLWTNAPNQKAGNVIAGMAELPNCAGATWAKAKQRWQLMAWFGDIPDFVITLDAPICAQASDLQFCALAEHELLHCGVARDAYGMPKFSREDGRPIFALRGHDVEEFVSVVRRYGVGTLNPRLRELVEVAQQVPQVAETSIRLACGNCAGVVV